MEEETDGRDSSHRQQQKLQQHQRQQYRQAAAPATRSRFLGCFALSRTKSSKAAASVPVPEEEEDGLPEQHRKRKRSQQHQQEQEETAAQRKRQKLVSPSESIVSISSSESSSFDPTALLAEHEEPPQQLRIPGAEDDWLFTSSSKHATSASHSPTRTATDSDATRPTPRRRTAPLAATPELEEAPLSEAEKRERQRRTELAHSQAATSAACPSSSAAPARRVPTVTKITSPPPRDREHKQHQEASDVQQKLARHSSGSSISSRSWKITDATTTALPPFCPPSLAGHRVAPPGTVDQEGRSATADTQQQQQQQQVPDSAESTKTAFFSSHAPSSQGSLVSSRSWFQLAVPLDSALARPAAAASATGEHGECRGLDARHMDDTTPAAQDLAVDRVEDSQTTGASPAAGRTMPGVSIKVEDVPTAQTSVSLGNAISNQSQPPVSQQQPSEPASPRAAPPAPVSARGSPAESPDLRSTSPEVVVPNLSARKPGRPPRLSASFDTDEETASDNALRPDFGKKRQQLRNPKTATAGEHTYSRGSASETGTDRRKQGRRKPQQHQQQQQQLLVESDTQTDGSRASSGLGRIALALAKPFSRNPNPTREEKIDLAARTGLTTSESGLDAEFGLDTSVSVKQHADLPVISVEQVGDYYSKERRRAGIPTLLRPGQYRTSASLEPLGTTSAVSDRTSFGSSSSSSESETERVDIVEEADTSDDARYKDASSRRVKAELERAKKELQPFFPSSSLTSIADSNASAHPVTLATGTRPTKSARKERLVRGRLTAAQKGKGRAIEPAQAPESSTEHDFSFSFDDTDIEPNNVPSRAAPRQGRPSRRGQPVRLGRAQPGLPPRSRHGLGGHLSYQVPAGPPTSSGVTRRPKAASGSVPPPAFGEVEANPARYTRSRTSVANPNTAQCHRCEAFYSKSGCFKCITCDGAVCQRCLIEHYSDQGVYIAIVAFLVGKMREELRLAKSQQHKGTSDLTDGIVMETGTLAAEGEVGFSSSAMSRVFNLPPTVDLSTLDFQCPVCKMLCMCANCLRGPYPIGHPLHKSSLLAAAAEAGNPPQPEYADGDGTDEDCDIDEDAIQVVTGRRRPMPRSDSEDELDVEVEHYSPPRLSSGPHAARRRSANRTAPSSFSVHRSHEALQQARADCARMDEDENEVVPFVVTRPKSTAVSNPRANAVPRLGSPPLGRSGSAGMHQVEQSNGVACTEAPLPVRRSARVRLATKVGEQLGAGKGAKSTASGPVEPVFTFPEDVWSTAATPGTEYEGQLSEDADGAETEQLAIGPIEEFVAELADAGRMTLEEEDEMVRQFASIPDATATGPYDGSDAIIPDFAYALSGSLGELDNTTKTASTLDMASGSTISTASTDSSLASPSAFPDGQSGPLHSFDLESTKPPTFLDLDAFIPDQTGNRPGDDWMDFTSGLNFSPSKCGGIGFDSAEWQHTLQFYDDVF